MARFTVQDEEKLRLLKSLDEEEQQKLMDILTKYSGLQDQKMDERADRLLERSFSPKERLELEFETLAQAFEYRRRLLSDTITASRVAEILGTSRQTPHDRVKAQTLLAVQDNGAVRFPLWQFDPEGPDGVLRGFPAVLKALQFSDFAKLSWFVRPNPFLDGRTPKEALKQGDHEAVLQEAEAAGYGQN